MQHIDIEKMAQGYPPSVIGKDCEEVTIALAKRVLSLQQKLDALAVENALLNNAIGAIADAYETGVADLLAQEIDNAVNSKTPATDALLNAVRAEGVEMYANLLKNRYDGIEYELIGNCETSGEEMRISDIGEVESALSFAAQLRALTDTTESLEGGK